MKISNFAAHNGRKSPTICTVEKKNAIKTFLFQFRYSIKLQEIMLGHFLTHQMRHKNWVTARIALILAKN